MIREQATEQEQVEATMAKYGVDEIKARFIIALERGATEGDVIPRPPSRSLIPDDAFSPRKAED